MCVSLGKLFLIIIKQINKFNFKNNLIKKNNYEINVNSTVFAAALLLSIKLITQTSKDIVDVTTGSK